MCFKFNGLPVLIVFLVTGCASEPVLDTTLGYGPAPTLKRYTEPEDSGLKAVRPYPNPDDVCVVLAENAATVELLDDSALLIGCPKHEKGAIADRKGEGARVVAHARHWTLLSLPN